MEFPIIKDGDGARLGNSASQLAFFGATPVAQQAALTAADGGTVDATYGAPEAAVLSNAVTRIAEIETALQNLGLIA